MEKIKELFKLVEENDNIYPEMYTKYNVKRGLRNSDGSGVLVGLTNISAVFGFQVIDEDTKPMEGELFYRGYSIGDLVNGFLKEKRQGFDELSFLVLFGKLPTKDELDSFSQTLKAYRGISEEFNKDIIMTHTSRDHMNMLARSVLALYREDEKSDDLSISNLMMQSMNLIAKMPTLIAYTHRAIKYKYFGESLVVRYPTANLSTVDNFLHLMRESGEFTKLEADTLDLCLSLHIDHGGGNNSTFTTHVVSSSGTDTYSTISAAIGSLKGPLHGGANRWVTDMMDHVKDYVKDWSDEGEIAEYVKKLLKRQAFDRSGKVYGIGHAVYTKSDPRAVILKEKAKELAMEKDRYEEFMLYDTIERITPDIFEEVKGYRKILSPNVDFYSGFVYDCLNLPREIYTPLFVMARIVGWCAHRVEEIRNGRRIIRPAYKNVAYFKDYKPMDQR